MKPVRIQRKRTKGWKMPPNTVSVTRPGKWGNPYRVLNGDVERSVRLFRRLFEVEASRLRHMVLGISSGAPGYGEGKVLDMKLSLHELRGKNLACWCALDQPCHADVLLELANPESGQ
ncbi:MAG TPA: DUF4326 domain-containing protein [Afipia sp.]